MPVTMSFGVVVQDGHEVLAASQGGDRQRAAHVGVQQLQLGGGGAVAARLERRTLRFAEGAGLTRWPGACRSEVVGGGGDAGDHVLGLKARQVVVAQVAEALVPELGALLGDARHVGLLGPARQGVD